MQGEYRVSSCGCQGRHVVEIAESEVSTIDPLPHTVMVMIVGKHGPWP